SRTARPAATTGALRHPCLWPTVSAASLSNFEVPARSRETVELPRRRIVSFCCNHGGAYLSRHRERIEELPTAEHAYELGSAVDRPSLIVRHGPFRSLPPDPNLPAPNIPAPQHP